MVNQKIVKVGKCQLGRKNHIYLQSMTTTKTANIGETVKQILQLEKIGCELIRVAVLDFDDAKAISQIKPQINIPIIADIHFNYKLALLAIENGADKIRLNPGNIDKPEQIAEIVQACQKYQIPIRIGVNEGSLPSFVRKKYPNRLTPHAMILGLNYYLDVFRKLNFDNLVVSLKSSDPELTYKTYLLASKKLPYPLHIGVTEAGPLIDGCIKTTLGLAPLLKKGIGATMRISINDDPCYEIMIAKKLLRELHIRNDIPELIACPTCGRLQYDIFAIVKEMDQYLMQHSLKIRVAMMGCSVNGVGEASHADLGFFACANDKAMIYLHNKYLKTVHKDEIISTLKTLIQTHFLNKEQLLKSN